MRHLIEACRRRLPLVHFAVDAGFWVVALPVAVWLRYDYSTESIGMGVLRFVGMAVVLQAAFGYFFGLYRRRWQYGTFDEVKIVALTAASVGEALTLALMFDHAIPRSVPALATGASLLGHIAARSAWRLYIESRHRPHGENLQRIVVVGAGEAAGQIVRLLVANPESPYLPVALVDDDPNKRNLRLSGVGVAGTTHKLQQVAQLYRAASILIAIPSADNALIQRVTATARDMGLPVMILPRADQLFGPINIGDIRPISEVDLLGREPAEIDTAAVAGYITGRRVLVTGAGGSIGSELCRQLTLFEPSQLLLLDRDENGLHATQLSIHGRALLEDPCLILASIRDADRVDEIFANYHPDVVFHAAALKHLPLLEMHPDEGWKTNVRGTQNLLESAQRHGVDRFVNVSTDKAANPTSVLGWTKRITERLTAHQTTQGDMDCVSVRFGNVLGSNGSVLKAFEAQVAMGSPITVTHPDITRYFMTISEAARLTIYAGAIGKPGEVLILDMGEPVRILDVAQRFATQHDPPLEIVFTGLRHNEKMHEDLVADSEHGERPIHKMITHVAVDPLSPTEAELDAPTPTVERLAAIATQSTTSHDSSSMGAAGT